MDVSVVVTAELGLLLGGPLAEGHAHVGVGILGAHDVTDLTAGVRRNAGVGVFDLGVEFLAEALDLLDQRQMEPHALTLGAEDTVLGKGVTEQLEEFGTKERLSGT